jgi:hypothetical protein
MHGDIKGLGKPKFVTRNVILPLFIIKNILGRGMNEQFSRD